jgi:hypothetical protein
VATRNIGGSAMLMDNACPALGGQPTCGMLPRMPRELAARGSIQNNSGLPKDLLLAGWSAESA